MKTSEFVELYLDLFAGRPDTYAIRREWKTPAGEDKVAYVPSVYAPTSEHPKKRAQQEQTQKRIQRITEDIGTKEYGPEAALAHLQGEHFLGVYPLDEKSEVRFFALDFDGKNGDPWEEAVRQMEVFRDEAQIPVCIERSRSGNGYHIWGFLEEWLPAVKVRGAIRPFIEHADTFDRMFPNQDYITGKKPLGNLIALPLYGPTVLEGKGAFVQVGEDGEPVEIEDQKQFLTEIVRIETHKIYELFADAPTPTQGQRREVAEREGEIEPLPGAFKVVNEEYGCEWIRWQYEHPEEVSEPDWWMLAHQFAQLEGGRDLFHEWSSQDPARYDPDDTDLKFDNALDQNAPHTCEYIREHTQGVPCYCDERFEGVLHPYDLALVPVSELIQEAEDTEVVETAAVGIVNAFEWVREVLQDPDAGMGLPYGIAEIDTHTRLRESDLVIIAARPGMGKTAFAVDIVGNLAWDQQVPTYFFSMEMSKEQLWRRMLANRAQVSLNDIIQGNLDKASLQRLIRTRKIAETGDVPVYVNDYIRDPDRLVDTAGELIFEFGPGPIVVDYLQLAKGEIGERAQEKVARVTDEYKAMGKLLGVPVVSLAQLNRSADDAESTSQTYDHWLRDSGVIEQTADVIWFILGSKGPGVVERVFVLHKERHRSAQHRIPLEFSQELMAFGPPGTWGVTSPQQQTLTARLKRAAMTQPLRHGPMDSGLMAAIGDDDDYDLGEDEDE